MRLGIDIDGVVCDFDVGFDRIANKIWPGRFNLRHHTEWDWKDSGMTKADKDAIWEKALKVANFWLTLPAYPESVRAIAVHRIKYPEDEIFYVTARVDGAGMPAMHQTQQWLNECGIGGLGTAVIVDHSGDKVPIFNALECDANVDDKLEAVIEHSKRTRGAYLLSRPWNEADRPSGIRTVASLEEFFKVTRRNVSAGV